MYILKIESKVLELQTITWLTICHLLSSSVSPPFPKPKWFRNRSKECGNFTVLLQGPTETWVRVIQRHKKTVKSAHDGFYITLFLLQETENTFYCRMDINSLQKNTHDWSEVFKSEISHFCNNLLQATFPDLCSQHLHSPLTNTVSVAQNIILKPLGDVSYRP